MALKPAAIDADVTVVVATVTAVDGVQLVKDRSSHIWSAVQEGDALRAGDLIRTGAEGDLRFSRLGDRGDVEAEPDSEFSLDSTEGDRFSLVTGALHLNVRESSPLSIDGQQLSVGRHSVYREAGQDLLIDPSPESRLRNPHGLVWRAPALDSEHRMNPEDPQSLSFNWQGGPKGHVIRLEFGSSRKSLKAVAEFPVEKGHGEHLVSLGKQYWRFSLVNPGTNKTLWSSPTSRLIVAGQFPPPVVSPVGGVTLSPQADSKSDHRMTVDLRWIPQPRFSAYKAEIASDAEFTKILHTEELPAESDKAEWRPPQFGSYHWRLSGLEDKTQAWVRTRAHPFRVAKPEIRSVQLTWVTAVGSVLHYAGETPSATLEWKAEPAALARSYRVRWASPFEELSLATGHRSAKTSAQIPLSNPGLHRAVVEALGSDDEIIGSSPILHFEVRPQPRLRAPAFASADLQLQASPKGALRVAWEPIENAQSYQLELKTPEGQVQHLLSPVTQYNFTRLMPGTYELRVIAIDTAGRPGEWSARRMILVPATSSIKPIRVRKVEVE